MKLSRILWMSLLSLAVGLAAVLYGELPPPSAKTMLQPNLPFANFVYGVGTVEPNDRSHRLNPTKAGVIKKIWVKVGETVPQGAPLFQMDDTQLQAQLKVAEKSLQLNQKRLYSAQHLLKLVQKARDAISEKSLVSSQDALIEAQAELYLAQAKKKVIETQIQQTLIKAPFPGKVLSINCLTGQDSDVCLYKGVLALGAATYNLRVNIDEYDIYQFQPHSKAIAVVQGHPDLSVPIVFDYLEPDLRPKVPGHANGRTTERIDTHVLQAVYHLVPTKAFPVYVNQTFDVYIQDQSLDNTK